MRDARSTTRTSELLAGIFLGVTALALAASPRIALGQVPHVAVVRVDPATYAPESFSARQEAAQQFYATHGDAYDFGPDPVRWTG